MRHGGWLAAFVLLGGGAQALERVDGFGTNPGNLVMFKGGASAVDAGLPLVVLLHGCGGGAQGLLSSVPAWEPLATQQAFALLLPQQQAVNNASGCFNWFLPDSQTRDAGEPASIVEMVRALQQQQGLDPARTYVFGFSAGAAMAIDLLALYPDVFSAGAVAAGIPFACAQSAVDGFTCMNPGVDRSPAQWAAPVLAARAGVDAGVPRLAVWQGLSDLVVRPNNRTELIEQWSAVNGADAIADETGPIASGGQRSRYTAPGGGVVLELNEIPGVGHQLRDAWVADMAQFFGLLPQPATDAGVDAGAGPTDAGGPSNADAGADGGALPGGDGGFVPAPDAGARADAGPTTVQPLSMSCAVSPTELGAVLAALAVVALGARRRARR